VNDSKPKRCFPVIYVDRPGQKGTLAREKSPVIEVVIGWQTSFKKVRALVDTGADDIFVDEGLLELTGCQRLKQRMRVRTQHGEMDHAIFRATLIFPAETDLRCDLDVVAAKIGDGNKAYSAILGTSFLEMGRLVIEPEAKSCFTFHERYIGGFKKSD
jgi:predicted aspartyl protease